MSHNESANQEAHVTREEELLMISQNKQGTLHTPPLIIVGSVL
jgi:hypothetical protein